jgi:hypothetical protein
MGISILTAAELSDLPANAIDLTPFLGEIMLLLDVLEIAGIIPNPIDLLIQEFSGRPREQATAQVVGWLTSQRNPAAKLFGITLSRLLTDDNIVISDSTANGQKLLGQARGNFVDSLVAQGATPQNAQTIAQIALSTEAQNGTAVSDFLKQPAPQGFGIAGPQTMASLYSKALQLGQAAGKTGTTLTTYATKYTFKHANLDDLLNTSILPSLPQSYTPTAAAIQSGQPCAKDYTYDSTTNTCYINSIIPTTGQICPPGYAYDATSYLCDYTPPPNTGQGGGGTGTSPGGGGGFDGNTGALNPLTLTIPPPPAAQPGGDELSDCCNSTAQYLYYVASMVQDLALAQAANAGSTQSDACCTAVVNVLTQMGVAISNLPTAWAAANPPASSSPPDFTAIVAALTAIQTSIAQLDADAITRTELLAAAIQNAGKAIATASPTDVSGIVQQLSNLVTQGDVPQGVLDYLLAQGYISSSDAQIIQGAPWAEVIVTVFRTWGWNALLWVASWVGIAWTGKTWTMNSLGETIADVISNLISGALTAGAAPLLPEITGLIDGVAAALAPTGAVSIGNIGVNPDLLLAKTLSPALILNAVALVCSYFGWELSESLEKYVDWGAALTGLEELKDVLIGSLFKNGVAKVADMQAKAKYQQELPSFERLAQMAAQGWITQARAAALAPYTGIPAELVTPTQNASFTNLPTRMLMRLFESPLFSQSDLLRIMTEHGMRPADQTVYLNSLPYLSTASQRTQLQSAYEAAYTAGLLSDAALLQALTNLQNDTDYQSLILTRCQVELATSLSKELETSYLVLAKAGVIDPPTYASNLEGIGLQPNKVNTLVAVLDNQLLATAYRQATAAEKALVKATTNEERKAALKNFATGNIDATGLAAALVLTGLTAVQAAAWVDLAVLQKGGNLRLTYGMQLAPNAAAILRARVNAIVDQRKKSLLTDAQFTSQLQALQIGQPWINALLAAADANIDVTGSPTLVGVSTS